MCPKVLTMGANYPPRTTPFRGLLDEPLCNRLRPTNVCRVLLGDVKGLYAQNAFIASHARRNISTIGPIIGCRSVRIIAIRPNINQIWVQVGGRSDHWLRVTRKNKKRLNPEPTTTPPTATTTTPGSAARNPVTRSPKATGAKSKTPAHRSTCSLFRNCSQAGPRRRGTRTQNQHSRGGACLLAANSAPSELPAPARGRGY